MIGSTLCALVALAFGALGVGSYAAPRALAAGYGLPADTPPERAYLRAVGTRDLVLGLLVARFLFGADSRAELRTTIALSAIVAAGDFAAVTSVRGTSAKTSLATHAGGLIGLLAIWGVLGSEL